MTKKPAKELLEKFLHEDASPIERIQVENWYRNLKLPDDQILPQHKKVIRERMLRNIRSHIRIKRARDRIWKKHWVNIAAVMVICMSLALAFLNNNFGGSADTQITASTEIGQRRTIRLSDGSEITLFPSTQVIYPKIFNDTAREIKLIEGKVFFSISHDNKRPFTVKLTHYFKVNVLGTSFTIRNYKAENNLKVAVTTGKVAVHNKIKMLGTLVKNQILLVDRHSGKWRIRKDQYTHPIDINFVGATLEELARQLGYLYNVRILIQNKSLLDLKTTATFSSAQSPEEILEIIGSLHRIKVVSEHNNKTFKLYDEIGR